MCLLSLSLLSSAYHNQSLLGIYSKFNLLKGNLPSSLSSFPLFSLSSVCPQPTFFVFVIFPLPARLRCGVHGCPVSVCGARVEVICSITEAKNSCPSSEHFTSSTEYWCISFFSTLMKLGAGLMPVMFWQHHRGSACLWTWNLPRRLGCWNASLLGLFSFRHIILNKYTPSFWKYKS